MEQIFRQSFQKEPILLITRFQASNLLNVEILNLYRFRSPSLWYLVMAALEKTCRNLLHGCPSSYQFPFHSAATRTGVLIPKPTP